MRSAINLQHPAWVTASAAAAACLLLYASLAVIVDSGWLTVCDGAAAGYEFTTLTCIPGMIRYKGAKIQLLDLPGIIEGAKDGKGRGRQVRGRGRRRHSPCSALCKTPAVHGGCLA